MVWKWRKENTYIFRETISSSTLQTFVDKDLWVLKVSFCSFNDWMMIINLENVAILNSKKLIVSRICCLILGRFWAWKKNQQHIRLNSWWFWRFFNEYVPTTEWRIEPHNSNCFSSGVPWCKVTILDPSWMGVGILCWVRWCLLVTETTIPMLDVVRIVVLDLVPMLRSLQCCLSTQS